MVKDLGISKSTITFKVNLYKLIKKIPKCLHCILTLSQLGFFMYVKQLGWGKITPPE